MRVTAYPWGVWYSRNLTPDPDRAGRVVGGRTLSRDHDGCDPGRPAARPLRDAVDMVLPADRRRRAGHPHYLKSLPPMRTPCRRRKTCSWPVEAVGGRLLARSRVPEAVEFWGGNAAVDPPCVDAVPTPWSLRPTGDGARLGTLLLGAGVAAPAAPAARAAGDGDAPVAAGTRPLVGWIALAVWPPLRWMSHRTDDRLALPRRAELAGRSRRKPPGRWPSAANIRRRSRRAGSVHTPAAAFCRLLHGPDAGRRYGGRWRVYGSVVSRT